MGAYPHTAPGSAAREVARPHAGRATRRRSAPRGRPTQGRPRHYPHHASRAAHAGRRLGERPQQNGLPTPAGRPPRACPTVPCPGNPEHADRAPTGSAVGSRHRRGAAGGGAVPRPDRLGAACARRAGLGAAAAARDRRRRARAGAPSTEDRVRAGAGTDGRTNQLDGGPDPISDYIALTEVADNCDVIVLTGGEGAVHVLGLKDRPVEQPGQPVLGESAPQVLPKLSNPRIYKIRGQPRRVRPVSSGQGVVHGINVGEREGVLGHGGDN